jgi:thiol-disulfide isomerase/thioredoxin
MALDTRRAFRMSLAAVTLFTVLINAHAAPFDLVDSRGQPQRLADYKGRYVVLNFWATWCVPCIQEIPEIAAFAKAHPEVVVIGVAVDAEDNLAKVKQFAAKTGHDYPLVFSNAAVEKQLGDPRALPTTRVYDPTGKVTYDKPGRVTQKSLEDLTKRAQGGKA